jgi:hypothetical protein
VETDPSVAALKPPDLLRAIADPSLNAFLSDRRFVCRVDRHPGSAALAAEYGTTAHNAYCGGRGIKCIDHTVAQLHELRIVHALARTHLRSLGAWPMDAQPADGRPGAELGPLVPIVKSRPDVLLAEGWKANLQLSRMHKAFASAVGASARVLGHTGPWHGGWGDIAWVMPLATFDRVVRALEGPGQPLNALLADDTLGGFDQYEYLAAFKAKRQYHAEQAWREILIKNGLTSYVTGWFAGLAKGRVVRFSNGTIGVDKWHCYRDIAWREAQPWLRLKGVPPEFPPMALPTVRL